jgi:hypothetical protein
VEEETPGGSAYDDQERELEKVNAFYLQKEAEVCRDRFRGWKEAKRDSSNFA